jgi:hypothetical protein
MPATRQASSASAHQGLSYNTLYNCRKQLRENKSADDKAVPLIELPVISPQDSPTWRIELDLGQGIMIRIHSFYLVGGTDPMCLTGFLCDHIFYNENSR